jgi:hypothetical protein
MRTSTPARLGLVVVAVTAAVAGGCTGDQTGAGRPAATTAGRSTPPARSGPPTEPGTSPAPACAVTIPRPVPTTEPWRRSLFGAATAYGNGKLWVGGLGEDGVISFPPDSVEQDGSVGVKFGWWRAVPGPLRITGQRLDATAPPAQSSVPDGYGDTGFQASGVHFPTLGCWEVTGRVGSTSLRFVTLVRVQG